MPPTNENYYYQNKMFQVAGIYMSTRLVVNVSQVFIPLYLHRTLGLAARALAVIPLAMYLGSLSAAALQRFAPRSFTRCAHYALGSICAIISSIWIYIDSGTLYKEYFIYVVAVLIGKFIELLRLRYVNNKINKISLNI